MTAANTAEIWYCHINHFYGRPALKSQGKNIMSASAIFFFFFFYLFFIPRLISAVGD